MPRSHVPAAIAIAALSCLLANQAAVAEDKSLSVLTVSAEPSYLLRYDLKDGEVIKYQVTHMAKTKTRIRRKDELTNVRSLSTKVVDGHRR